MGFRGASNLIAALKTDNGVLKLAIKHPCFLYILLYSDSLTFPKNAYFDAISKQNYLRRTLSCNFTVPICISRPILLLNIELLRQALDTNLERWG